MGIHRRWNCTKCLHTNYTLRIDASARCERCASPPHTKHEIESPKRSPRIISCPACTFSNSWSASSCLMCDESLADDGLDINFLPEEDYVPKAPLLLARERPIGYEFANKRRAPPSPFDEPEQKRCGHCRKENDLNVTICKHCSRLFPPWPVPVKTSVEKPPDGVLCDTCTFINPPRSMYCQVCRCLLVVCSEWEGKKGRFTILEAEHRKAELLKKQRALLDDRKGESAAKDDKEKSLMKKARGKVDDFDALMRLHYLAQETEEKARERRRADIRKEVFGLSFQSLTLRDICFITLIESLEDAKSCIQLLLKIDSVRFSFGPLEDHCLAVLAKRFSDSIFSLEATPSEKERTSENEALPVDLELMRQLGVHYHGGREHLVLQDFALFMELPRRLQEIVLHNVWNSLHEQDVTKRCQMVAFLKRCHTPMNPKRKNELKVMANFETQYRMTMLQKLRFFDFCLWFRCDAQEGDLLIGKIISDGLNPSPLGFTHHLYFFQGKVVDKGSGKGKEPLDPFDPERSTSERIRLSPETASWFYDRAIRGNYFALQDFLERYIKNNWLLVTAETSWTVIPVERREKLETEYQKEMVDFYQEKTKEHEESSFHDDDDEFMWECSQDEEEDWECSQDEEDV